MRRLGELCLKHIYDTKSMTFEDTDNMQRGIMAWDQNRFKTESQETYLLKLCQIMKKNDDGKLENRKKLFADKNVDYKKFHRLKGIMSW